MKVYIAAYQPGRIGGGWTFVDNFVKGIETISRQSDQPLDDVLITGDYAETDIFFIASPSMVQREAVEQAKADGKKIVLRIDNAVRNSRNRNTGMSRMKDFYLSADLVIFQSQWAREYLLAFLDPNDEINPGEVILNGVDLEKYYDNHEDGTDNILYSRFNRDETKNWEVARYWFSQYQLKNPNAVLHIVGQFSQELRDGNFDFYNGERFTFYGTVDSDSLAKLYSISSLLYTYYNDACSNTLIEALVSGCDLVGDSYYHKTGGAKEVIDTYVEKGRDYFSTQRMCKQYIKAIEGIL